jgi:stage II sporulation protein D
MRRSAALVLTFAALAGACAPRPPRPVVGPPPIGEAPRTIRVGIPEARRYRVVAMPLEAYVAGAALAEISLGGVDQAAAQRLLAVQALLARTYAAVNMGRHAREGFDLCATTHCQLFKPADLWPARFREQAEAAVAETRGLFILHDGAPILALYHADCGGHTSAAHEVWPGPSRPYLQPVGDPFCRRQASRWEWAVPAGRLAEVLRADPRTRFAGSLDRIRVARRDEAGRAVDVGLGSRGRVVRASVLRAVVIDRFGAGALRSTHFTVRRAGDRFVFEGRGHGHGAGLCQAGAVARAQAGQSPEQILGHYFRGARIGALPAAGAASRSSSRSAHEGDPAGGAHPDH